MVCVKVLFLQQQMGKQKTRMQRVELPQCQVASHGHVPCLEKHIATVPSRKHHTLHRSNSKEMHESQIVFTRPGEFICTESRRYEECVWMEIGSVYK